jgi:hypothetical protein
VCSEIVGPDNASLFDLLVRTSFRFGVNLVDENTAIYYNAWSYITGSVNGYQENVVSSDSQFILHPRNKVII